MCVSFATSTNCLTTQINYPNTRSFDFNFSVTFPPTLPARPLTRSVSEPFTLHIQLVAPLGFMVLLGPSGCGKSSLLQTIAGLKTPRWGHIRIGDQQWFNAAIGCNQPPHQRQMGYVFQKLALFPHLSVADNIGFAIPKADPQRRSRIAALAQQCEVTDLLLRSVTTLSGGQAQRVAIARALAARPRLLLLDEPFNAMDLTLRQRMCDMIAAYHQETNVPVIMVTHDRQEAAALANTLVWMEEGKIVDVV